jgi:HSP20 family protein
MIEFQQGWFTDIDMVQREMERLLDHISGSKPPAIQFSPRVWEPAADVYETEKGVVVVVELAGVSEEDIEILVSENIFIIRGERRNTRFAGRKIYHQMEIASGPFERTIMLPAKVDADQSVVSYKNGLVKVVIPKVEEIRDVKIKVTLL